MAQAIERFVPDGATIALGLALEPLIPFAAGHEIIRQQRRDLELVGPISDALFDQIMARKGFAIFAVDNRGTPGRDRKFQAAIRHEFGAIELKNIRVKE